MCNDNIQRQKMILRIVTDVFMETICTIIDTQNVFSIFNF